MRLLCEKNEKHWGKKDIPYPTPPGAQLKDQYISTRTRSTAVTVRADAARDRFHLALTRIKNGGLYMN